MEPLDNPVWHALCGPQATLAEGSDGARRYRPDYAPFSALADDRDGDAWRALGRIVEPGGIALVLTAAEPRAGWLRLRSFGAHQMLLPDDASQLGFTTRVTMRPSVVRAPGG